jgi:hypothetical protein
MISARPCPACWIWRVSLLHVALSPAFEPNRITPAVSRALSRRRMYSGRALPGKLEMVT